MTVAVIPYGQDRHRRRHRLDVRRVIVLLIAWIIKKGQRTMVATKEER